MRRAKTGATDPKKEKYLDKGAFSVLTTTHTSPEKYDLVLFAESRDPEAEPLLTPAITSTSSDPPAPGRAPCCSISHSTTSRPGAVWASSTPRAT